MLSGRQGQPMMTSWRDMALVMLPPVSVLMVTSMMRMTQPGRLFSVATVERRYSIRLVCDNLTTQLCREYMWSVAS